MARRKTIWVERLGIVRLLVSLLTVLINRNTTVYYDMLMVTANASKGLAFLKKCYLGRFFSCEPFLRDMRDESGTSLYYRLDANMRIFLEDFCRKHLGEKPDGYRNMVKCYLTVNLQRRARFATIADYSTKDQSEEQSKVIYFSRDPLNLAMKDFWRNRGFDVKEQLNIRPIKSSLILIPLYYLICVLITRFSKDTVKTNINSVRPSVWIEYTAGDNVDFLFWLKHLDRAKFDCACYLDRPDSPPNEEVLKEIEKKYGNVGWIDGGFFANLKSATFNWMSVAQMITQCIEFYPAGSPLFLRILHFQYCYWMHIYKSLFSRYSVKVFIQHQDVSWKQEVQRKAIESAGGIMVGFHWSSYHVILTPIHLFPFHVFFVWGKIFRDVIDSGYNTCSYILPSGLWITPKDGDRPYYSPLKKLDFTFTIFDSSVAYHLHQTPDSLSQFYTRVLEMLERNPNWGAIAKCKGLNIEGLSYLPNGRDIVNRFNALMKEKRLIAFDYSVLPMIAAENTDLCVCYGINSAGIIAALYGRRAIHWDCSWLSKHPFYKDRSQKIVFKTLDDMENAVRLAERGDGSVGDFNSWRRQLNFNDDFNADRRVGEFFNDFLNKVVKEDNISESLKCAVGRYIERNEISKDFFRVSDHLWEE